MFSHSVVSNPVHGDSPGKNTGVDCHSFLQGNFLTQGSNPGLLHCWQPLYCLSYQGSHSFWAVKLIFTLINRTICHMNCQASRGLQCRSKHRNEGVCAAKVTTPYSKYFSIGGDFAPFSQGTFVTVRDILSCHCGMARCEWPPGARSQGSC